MTKLPRKGPRLAAKRSPTDDARRAFDPIDLSCYGAPTLRRLRYLRAGARALGAAGIFVALVAGTGCGPARYVSQVGNKAPAALAAAKNAGAATHAPYEFTAASAYLAKAREEGAYAEYQLAVDYGRKAEELANRAREIAERESARAPTPTSPPGGGAPQGSSPFLSEPPRRATDSL